MKHSIFFICLLMFLFQLKSFSQKKIATCSNSNSELPFSDTDLSYKKLKEIIEKNWPDRKISGQISIAKIKTNDDWIIEYQHNIPKYMVSNRIISYFYKTSVGCFKVENMKLYRDYLGGGQFGEIHPAYIDTLKDIKIDCEELKL